MIRLGLVFLAVLIGATSESTPPRHEARYYRCLADKLVACELCPRRCVLAPGQRGACRVRENQDGTPYSLVYGRPCALNKEPIEKAPFFHFLPGVQRITLATVGCNQRCQYCQNWELSQASPEDVAARTLTPAAVVELAKAEKVPIVCFTYTEPVVFFEYMCDIARLCRQAGIRTAVVTGGYINPEPLQELCQLVDAIKIDLKGFTPDFYRSVCGSTLEPVLEACRIVAQSGTHLEIVNLVVPSLNDDTTTIKRMCRWLVENVGDTVPVHFTRFVPNYRLQNTPTTPVPTLETAMRIARATGLKYVYVGNVPGHKDESTRCPSCGAMLIERTGYRVTKNRIREHRCPDCRAWIHGVWQ